MRDLVGRLSYSTWLNDSVVFLAMAMLASRYPDVVVVDPLSAGNMHIPASRLKHQRLVLFPLNINNVHWCIILVVLNWDGEHYAIFYDPQCSPALSSHPTNGLWLSWAQPLLYQWLKRDECLDGTLTNLGCIPCVQVHAPKQTDGSNCGVLCIGQAMCYMTHDFALQQLPVLSPSQLCLMRLRIMYMIMTKATTRVDEAEELRGAEAITLFKASKASKASSQVTI
jgi:hypothetical protein